MENMTNEHQQVIGLAAAIQALTLVNNVAFKGNFDEVQAKPLFQSLVYYNPENAIEAYGSANNLRQGLQAIPNLLNNQANLELIRHLFSVIVIEGKLVKSPTILHLLRDKLTNLRERLNFSSISAENIDYDDKDDNKDDIEISMDLTSTEVVADFAEIYKQTASTIEPRIMVKGEAEYLRNEIYANQIRALLFAALRGASFFRHNEGSRRHIMFKSKQYINLSKELLAMH